MIEEKQYMLMNRDVPVVLFESSRDLYNEVEFSIVKEATAALPIGFDDIGQWIKNRQAPKHRAHIEALLKSCGCYDLEGYIRVTHALTLNDTFWVKPLDSNLQWEAVSLFRNEFDETIAHIAFEGGLYGEQFTTTSPEFGTDGAFAKCWIREADHVYLLKRGSTGARNTGLEPYSEMYASQVADKICLDYVPYEVVKYRGKLASKCPLFTSEQRGFVPIYKCIPGQPGIRKFMEYFQRYGCEDSFRRMLVLDALILNTDRHTGNFGMLFNTDTLEPVKMAPVFDHNQSLLPYAQEQDFKDLDAYLSSRPTRIGNDFNETAHMMLTPAIRADLRNLQGFRFNRDTKYALPEGRLKELENVIDMQIRNILKDIRLFVPADAKEILKKEPQTHSSDMS